MRRFKLMQILIKNKPFRVSFYKYFAGFALVVLVLGVTFGFILRNVYGLYLRDALSRYREQNIVITGDFVNYILDGVNQVHALITHNDEIYRVLTATEGMLPDAHGLGAFPTEEDEQRVRWSDINRAIGQLFSHSVLSPTLHSVYVFSYANNHVLSWTDFRTVETFHDTAFLDNHRAGRSLFVRTDMPGQNPSDVITLVRDVVRGGTVIGVAAFNINYNTFAAHMTQELYNAPEIAAVTNAQGIVFYAADRFLLNTDIRLHPIYGMTFAEAQDHGVSVMHWEARVIASVHSGDGITIISTVESTAIDDFRRQFSRLVLMGSVVGLLCAFLVAFGIALRLYGNMIRLVNLVSEGGDPFIIESITSLTNHNRHIEHELAEKLIELKKAQVVVLQNQINPHFILNTLQIVNLNILKTLKADSDATRAIALLSDILQANINTMDDRVPLSVEIQQILKYLEIQKMRVKSNFSVVWDIDDALMQYPTVKFVIQPVLENCFKHGFTNDGDKEMHIHIRAAKTEDALILSVEDNGRGMEATALTALQSNIKNSHVHKDKHIGLCNVDKRIKLIYGEGYGLSVASSPGDGTTVRIRQRVV